MRKLEIVSTLRANRSKDGKDHPGKRTISLPDSVEEIGAWAKTATAEANKYGLRFDVMAVLERGTSLLHQGDMNRKLAAKFANQEAGTTRAPRDLKDVGEI